MNIGYNSSGIKTIIEVFVYLLLCMVSISGIVPTYVIWSIFYINLIYSLSIRIKYKMGRKKGIYFPTLNDGFFKSTGVFFGLVFLGFGVFWYYSVRYLEANVVFPSLIGLLLLLNGMFHLPKGKMQIRGNVLEIRGIDDKIDLGRTDLENRIFCQLQVFCLQTRRILKGIPGGSLLKEFNEV